MNFEEAEVGLDISEDIVPARPVVSSSIVSQTFDGFLDPPLKLQTNQTQCGGESIRFVLIAHMIEYTRTTLAGWSGTGRILAT